MAQEEHLSEDFDDKYETEDESPAQGLGKAAIVGFSVLCVGTAIALWYGISLSQVALSTGNLIYTELGAGLFPLTALMALVLVVAGISFLVVFIRNGVTTQRTKYANMTTIPWDLVGTYSVVGAVIIFVLAVLTRIAAEAQIVGAQNIAWYGDLALGSIFLIAGFAVCFIAFGLFFHEAIKQQRKLEDESHDVDNSSLED